MASRRRTVLWTKRLLPVVALLLLASVALWPEISADSISRGSLPQRRLSADVQAGKLLQVRYHGLDSRNRPYTVTADEARRSGRNGSTCPSRRATW